MVANGEASLVNGVELAGLLRGKRVFFNGRLRVLSPHRLRVLSPHRLRVLSPHSQKPPSLDTVSSLPRPKKSYRTDHVYLPRFSIFSRYKTLNPPNPGEWTTLMKGDSIVQQFMSAWRCDLTRLAFAKEGTHAATRTARGESNVFARLEGRLS